MRGERTKRRIPARVFLSERMAPSNAAGETRGQDGKGTSRRTNATMRETTSARVKPSSWPRKAAAIIYQSTASPCWYRRYYVMLSRACAKVRQYDIISRKQDNST